MFYLTHQNSMMYSNLDVRFIITIINFNSEHCEKADLKVWFTFF